MPKITLNPAAATNAGIAASGARTYVEFALSTPADVRWSFGATFVEADSQLLTPGTARAFETAISQQAVSFGPGKGVVDVTALP